MSCKEHRRNPSLHLNAMAEAARTFNRRIDECAVAIGRELLPEVQRVADAMPRGMKDGELVWPSRWSMARSWARYQVAKMKRWFRHQRERAKR